MARLPSAGFERPVVILTGLGIPTAVATAMEAYMFLSDWAKAKRDAVHAIDCKGCLAALRGGSEAETARRLFAFWAEKNDILGPEEIAFATSRRTGSHGTA